MAFALLVLFLLMLRNAAVQCPALTKPLLAALILNFWLWSLAWPELSLTSGTALESVICPGCGLGWLRARALRLFLGFQRTLSLRFSTWLMLCSISVLELILALIFNFWCGVIS
jgi:hypothetical protein